MTFRVSLFGVAFHFGVIREKFHILVRQDGVPARNQFVRVFLVFEAVGDRLDLGLGLIKYGLERNGPGGRCLRRGRTWILGLFRGPGILRGSGGNGCQGKNDKCYDRIPAEDIEFHNVFFDSL